MKGNFLLPFFIKTSAFFLLLLEFCLYNDTSSVSKHLYNKNNLNGAPDKITFRVMAKHELGMESDYPDLKTNSSEFGDNEKIKNVEDGVSIYERMQKNYSKKYKDNKKGNKNKYAKKNGIYKLDCYCEEKIFNRIDEIKKLAKKNRGNDKNNFKKILNKKYGFKFTLACLFTLIGIILSSLTYGYSEGKDYEDVTLGTLKIPWQVAYSVIGILIILNFIILSMIIYIIIKFIKYEKLKEGKGKMSAMEYCRFCNEIF
ncbi:Plasmodium exported protein, unknown function [Plasmodium vivax]|uniref:Variable surface protein Vir35 n=1 Tax=Plasmodium vivax TaxID=5855 RepID=A0A565A609_PLAVI|nr:Plasmodium exported protein, unknown function [Plasmodium vivax]